MMKVLRFAAQAVVYAGFAVLVGYFSASPPYQLIAPGEAQIKLSLAYGGKPAGGCRDRTAEELAALPPNMRKAQICSRERLPLTVEFELDGDIVYRDVLPPSGVRNDGPSRMYEKFIVNAGDYEIALRMRSTDRDAGWDFETRRHVSVGPGDNLAIDFDPVAGGFVFPRLGKGG
ncbi:MAG: hypothetical protein JJ900_01760 [Rhodospirillales bacterium]|nr:hypothetical protein [Rhodospirillales bacterium]MBO6785548.1 hypothetical protein [Rhodospirillales bacterium]